MRTLTSIIFSCTLTVLCLSGIAAAADSDHKPSALSANGLYRVNYESRVQPVPLNDIHAWVIEVTDAQGKPVTGARITIDGGMPAHGHGLPTKPRVTKELGQGKYLVEGLMFQMPGDWVVDFIIESPAGPDKARIELDLGADRSHASEHSGHH